MDLISVIVPVYKVEKYIHKCIDSILNQTYKNLEIILVDDGSPDNCGKICDEYAKKDNRIKVIHKENGGLSRARNVGIDNSTGKYITFIDSDDWISKDYCETLYNGLISSGSDVSVIKFSLVVEKNTEITNVGPEKMKIEKGYQVFEGEEIIREILNRKTLESYVCGKLFSLELIKKNKLKEGVNYEDNIFSYDVLSSINKLIYIDKECYFYLKHGGTITATCSEKNLIDFTDSVMYRFDNVKEKYPTLELYNYYALLEKITSIGIKYIIANQSYTILDERLEKMYNLLLEYVDANEKEFIGLLNEFQKCCLYLIKYDVELYYSFLRERQEMKKLGKKL